MTAYHLTPASTIPSIAVSEAREKRRQVLAAVKQRRTIIYRRYFQKLRAARTAY